jgi:glycosyltransferase involved in cell wall biosynthesis
VRLRARAVVVADKEGLEAVAGLPFADRIKTVLQAEPNLSQARNDGIAHAAGDIVAFLDDDAVPEPTWAARHGGSFAPIARPRGGHGAGPGAERHLASMGTVSPWTAQGRDIALDDPRGRCPGNGAQAARHQHGVRRGSWTWIGGFDPAFRYYLDDTDLALRLADAGHRAQWLPDAQVHHAFAASDRRTPIACR